MLGIVYHTHLQVATIIIAIIMTVNALVCYPLHKKRNNYFSKFDSICGYIALIPFVSGLIAGITFMISYVLFYQALNHIIDKLCLLHLIYLSPLFFISLYLLIKSWAFKMKLEDGYLIIRNAFGFTSKYNIYKLKYKRRFGLFTIFYMDKKRKILIQSEYNVYNLEHVLDRIPRQK